MIAVTRACPRPEEWLHLADGEATENRASELRGHVEGCAACGRELTRAEDLLARLAAPVPGLDVESAVAAALRRLDSAPPAPPRPRRLAFPVAVAGLAAAAAVLLVVHVPRDDAGRFAARGGEVSWTKKVGVELWAVEQPLRRVEPGTPLSARTPLVVGYDNLDEHPAWLLAFALDARGEAHWLYPAYLEPGSDPASVRLEPSTVRRVFPDAAVLEGIGEGPVRFVFVVTREPMRVSDVERLGPAARDPAALRARWADARIDVVQARITRVEARR